jgi:hypothetical protein
MIPIRVRVFFTPARRPENLVVASVNFFPRTMGPTQRVAYFFLFFSIMTTTQRVVVIIEKNRAEAIRAIIIIRINRF